MTALDRLASALERRFGLRVDARGSESALASHAEVRRQAIGAPTLEAYVAQAVVSESELDVLASLVSNGWTWFFRDLAQLEALVDRWAASGRISSFSAWVAGCSTGEEAYGLAMLALERGVDVRITATDLDAARLEAAAQAVYGEWSLRAVPDSLRARWLDPLGGGQWRVRDRVRRMVELRRHNLMDPPWWGARYDAVLCRNVLIHCTEEASERIVANLATALAPHGELVLGASDVLPLARPRVPTLPAPLPCAEPSCTEPTPPPAPCEAEPVTADALLTMGNLLVEAHAFDHAESAYQRAEQIDPCSAELHLAWGVLHRKRGDWERAVASLRRATFLDDTLWPAWALLGGCLARLGAHAESRAALEQAAAARRSRPEPAWRSGMHRLFASDREIEIAPRSRGAAREEGG